MNMPYPARTKTPSPHPSIFLQFPPAFLCMVLHTCAGSVPCSRAFAFASPRPGRQPYPRSKATAQESSAASTCCRSSGHNTQDGGVHRSGPSPPSASPPDAPGPGCDDLAGWRRVTCGLAAHRHHGGMARTFRIGKLRRQQSTEMSWCASAENDRSGQARTGRGEKREGSVMRACHVWRRGRTHHTCGHAALLRLRYPLYKNIM